MLLVAKVFGTENKEKTQENVTSKIRKKNKIPTNHFPDTFTLIHLHSYTQLWNIKNISMNRNEQNRQSHVSIATYKHESALICTLFEKFLCPCYKVFVEKV